MRSRIVVGVFLLIALVGAGTLAARGNSYVGSDKQWTIVNFPNPVSVNGAFMNMGFRRSSRCRCGTPF